MSPYDRSDRRSRSVWSHWVPLVVTLTVATAGAAAWAWKQRKDGEDDAEAGLDYGSGDSGDDQTYGSSKDRKGSQPPPSDSQSFGVTPETGEGSNAGWATRMSGALRRTPSPQQLFDSTGKMAAAGMAAAGAAMGKALASIREEDQNPWQEEADAKHERGPVAPSKRRRTVALIVSADTGIGDFEEGDFHEHASILSHIPRHNDFSKIKLFVLIYAPQLKDTALENTSSNLPPPSLSSSFSNIDPSQAQTPGDESKPSALGGSNNAAYNAVYSQAMAIADKETMILPFTTPNGHVHILRHIQPEIVYLQASLAGDGGSIITTLQTWLRHDVVLVVGAESGSGGLADSESEAEKSPKAEKWWQRPDRVGRGRGVIVVDSMRVNDDWARRVQGIE